MTPPYIFKNASRCCLSIPWREDFCRYSFTFCSFMSPVITVLMFVLLMFAFLIAAAGSVGWAEVKISGLSNCPLVDSCQLPPFEPRVDQRERITWKKGFNNTYIQHIFNHLKDLCTCSLCWTITSCQSSFCSVGGRSRRVFYVAVGGFGIKKQSNKQTNKQTKPPLQPAQGTQPML